MQDIAYFTSTEELDRQKTTLLFIHGAGGSHHVWDLQSPLEKEFNIITVDLPGHGEAPGEGLESIDDMVRVVHELVHQKFSHLLPVVLAGHSMGGGIVQQYAINHPRDVKAIILVDTGARLKVTEQIFDYLAEDVTKAVDLIIQFSFHEKTDKREVEKSRQQLLKCPAEVMLKDFSACNVFNLFEEVKKIKSPALVICGSNDLLTPLKYSNYLQDAITGSKLVEIAGAGHMAMLEKPGEVNRAIKQFITSF